jgi:Rrf2 family protein
MLKINRQTDYAVRVILTLSKRKPGSRVPTSEIQREMLIPPVLIQRIVAVLAGGGFITTQPGRDGGVTLARLPSEINLLQVVEHFEGPIYLSDCVIKPDECPFSTRCPVTRRWARLKNVIRAELQATTFEELVHDAFLIESELRTDGSTAQTADTLIKDLGLSVE